MTLNQIFSSSLYEERRGNNGQVPEPGEAGFDWSNHEHTSTFVSQLCKRIDKDRSSMKSKILKEHLLQSRDLVLQKARALRSKSTVSASTSSSSSLSNGTCLPLISSTNAEQNNKLIIESRRKPLPLLPSHNSKEQGRNHPYKISFLQVKNKKSLTQQKIYPSNIENTYPDRPPTKSVVFLKSNYCAEDEKDLKFACYFGEDNDDDDEEHEEMMKELFDLDKREKLLNDGPEYMMKERQNFVDEILSQVIDSIVNHCSQYPTTRHRHGVRNIGMWIEQILDHISDLKKLDKGYLRERYEQKFASSITKFGNTSDLPVSMQGIKDCNSQSTTSAAESSAAESPSSRSSSRKHSAGSSSSPNSTKKQAVRNSEFVSDTSNIQYTDVMDSYRNLFCRRCFVYDCNIHGNLVQPNLNIQTFLALRKEKEGQVLDSLKTRSELSSLPPSPSPSSNTMDEPNPVSESFASTKKRKRAEPPVDPEDGADPKKRAKITPQSTNNESDSEIPTKLTTLQRAACHHAYQIFQGKEEKIAAVLGANIDEIKRHAQKHDIGVTKDFGPYCQMVDNSSESSKKSKKGSKGSTMNMYNPKWVKRIENAEIHPAFLPCDHDEPCSDETCSCIQNAFFCTKHCVWGKESRNFFRGCSCKKGQCLAKSCPCYTAGRECDPDLCRDCGACTDPPNKEAMEQNCRNDRIGMRRHIQLLVGRSQVKEAGWGVYNKTFVKKGDFIVEYIGEVISQEEAERRGCIYDKVDRSYLFNLTSDTVVDANRKGNKARFLNHSSTPNCYTKILTVNGDYRIGIFAKEDIEPQTELFFDYRYDVSIMNDLLEKPAMEVKWMKSKRMKTKKQASKKHAGSDRKSK